MKLHHWAAPLALLLLAGCQAPAATTPDPDPTYSVATHWDALETPSAQTPLADYWYNSTPEDLIPRDDYGDLVPYLGGEACVTFPDASDPFYYTDSLSGLTTTDGKIVTAPVFHISTLPLFDMAEQVYRRLPVYALARTLQDEAGEYYTATGLAAADGSWYTGLRFRQGVISTIAVCRDSALMMVDADSAVLISLADGSELAWYTPSDFLSPDQADYAQWFFADSMSWGMFQTYDHYLCFDPVRTGLPGQTRWIDGATGAFLDGPPAQGIDLDGDGRNIFQSVWCYPWEEPITLRYLDGSTETLPFAEALGDLIDASPDYLVFNQGGSYDRNVLTDHQGNQLAQGNIWLTTDQLTAQTYPCLMTETDGIWQYSTLDANGQPIHTGNDQLMPCRGLAPVKDDQYYRLMDLATGEDILRLPRWLAQDLPADD